MLLNPPSPLDEIVQGARERAQQVIDCSHAVRALREPVFFDYLDEVLQANDDCPILAAHLDEVAVEYRCVRVRGFLSWLYCVAWTLLTDSPSLFISLHVPGGDEERDEQTDTRLMQHLARRALYSRDSQPMSERLAILRELERYAFGP